MIELLIILALAIVLFFFFRCERFVVSENMNNVEIHKNNDYNVSTEHHHNDW